MVHINYDSKELEKWHEGASLSCNEDVATLLCAYEKCIKSINPANIVGVVDRDGYFACVVNNSGLNSFDLFEFINANFRHESGVEVNCANARFLFPAEISRGEYVDRITVAVVAGTGDLTDTSDETDTGFWDEEEVSETHYIQHPAMGTEVPIEDEDGVIFGRSNSRSGYAVDNDLMSRLHARVYLEGGKYMVEDLGSKNGTFVNNVKVFPGKDREIKPGNILRMANEEFRFV